MNSKRPLESMGEPIQVVVIGPPPGAHGGIGVLMQYLRETTSAKSQIRYLDSGVGIAQHSKWARIRIFLTSLLTLVTERHAIDVAHINMATKGSFYRKICFGWLCSIIKIPYIVHIHGGNILEFSQSLPLTIFKMQQRFIKHAKGVIVLGDCWVQDLSNLWGLDASHMYVVRNAVPDTYAPHHATQKNSIVFVGRFERDKGANELLEALEFLSPTHAIDLTIVGTVSDPNIQARITRLKQSSHHRITTTGWIKQEEIEQASAAAEVFVLPSYYEGFPLALLEAMSRGQAPIVSSVGSIPEVIQNGENGLLVQAGDANSLRSAIAEVLENENLRKRLGRNARRTWESELNLPAYRDALDRIWTKLSRKHHVR